MLVGVLRAWSACVSGRDGRVVAAADPLAWPDLAAVFCVAFNPTLVRSCGLMIN